MYEKINLEKKQYEFRIKLGIFITLFAFVMFLPVMTSIGFGGVFIIVPPFFGGFLFAAYNRSKIEKMSQAFKDQFLEEELKKIIPNSTYKMYDGFLEKEVVRSGLLRNEDRFHSEDMIVGDISGVSFKCSDIHQQDVKKTDKGTRTTTVFRGRFYEFDFPKRFKSNVIIQQRPLFDLFRGYNAVDMESVEFNSELQVYADNEHDAFYVLTPHFMERILLLDRKYNDKISFSIQNEKLFVAINSGIDYFDFKLNQPINEDIFVEYKNEFEDMVEFVELLKLNETIFKSLE